MKILFLGIGCDQEALEFFKLLNFAVLGFAPKTAKFTSYALQQSLGSFSFVILALRSWRMISIDQNQTM